MTISNSSFLNNTGSYSVFEEEHNLPFFDLLTLRRFKLNYIDISNNSECTNEFAFTKTNCYFDESKAIFNMNELKTNIDRTKDDSYWMRFYGIHNSFPHMRGTVHLENTNGTVIDGCVFERNDAGPIV